MNILISNLLLKLGNVTFFEDIGKKIPQTSNKTDLHSISLRNSLFEAGFLEAASSYAFANNFAY